MDKLYSRFCQCLQSSEQTQQDQQETANDKIASSNEVQLMGLYPGNENASHVNCLIAMPDNHIMCGDGEGKIFSFDYSSGSITRRWEGHDKSVTKLCVQNSTDGIPKWILSSSRDLTIKMWNTYGDRKCQQKFKGHHDLTISAVACHPNDKNVICSGSRDTSVALWDVSSGDVINTNTIDRNLVTDICWKGDVLAQTSEDKSLRLWDSRSLQVAYTFVKKQQILTSCDISGSQIITSSGGFNGSGCELTLWDSRNGTMPVHEFKGHTEKVNQCWFIENQSNSCKYAASVSADRTIRIWNVTNLTEESSFNVGNHLISFVQLPSDSTQAIRFAVASQEANVFIISAKFPSCSNWRIH